MLFCHALLDHDCHCLFKLPFIHYFFSGTRIVTNKTQNWQKRQHSLTPHNDKKSQIKILTGNVTRIWINSLQLQNSQQPFRNIIFRIIQQRYQNLNLIFHPSSNYTERINRKTQALSLYALSLNIISIFLYNHTSYALSLYINLDMLLFSRKKLDHM